jgi:hypothetical protein
LVGGVVLCMRRLCRNLDIWCVLQSIGDDNEHAHCMDQDTLSFSLHGRIRLIPLITHPRRDAFLTVIYNSDRHLPVFWLSLTVTINKVLILANQRAVLISCD